MEIRPVILKVVAGILIAIVPAALSYCQSMQEIHSKYQLNHSETAVGYSSLVQSVKELQTSVQEQHDQLVQLEAYISALELFIKPDARRMISVHRPQLPRQVLFAPPAPSLDSAISAASK